MKGWPGYFRYAFMHVKFKELDVWIRKRLRYCIWKQWKRPKTRRRNYIRMGVDKGTAYAWSCSRMGGWAQACSPMMKTTVTNERLKRRGYIEFSQYYQRFASVLNPPIKFWSCQRNLVAYIRRTAVYGPVCTVVWEAHWRGYNLVSRLLDYHALLLF